MSIFSDTFIDVHCFYYCFYYCFYEEHIVCMASQTNTVHFHDPVNINRLPPLQQNVDPRWGEPLPEPYINSSPGYNQRMAFHPVFLMSKPRMRGLTQIGVAHLQLALGIILNFFGEHIYTWFSYIIFWGPPFLICSGFLAVAAHGIVSSKLVRACNVFQTISILISISGLVLSCIDAYSIYSCSGNCGNVSITIDGDNFQDK
ncbi:uncharacterized protein LOC130283199 [Hyla sarda]|uniref:uncharacterized protein LOC130283199 n=1 Tax=Hyla sarda TaxID=327740 RepID=UPI0024C3ADF5|nr:uncharacterized protein LOC130283199 [Hyla sarda]